MSLCVVNRALGAEVNQFMLNVPDVKEESVTDYLVWKWRELDKRFHYLNVSSFTRQQESSTTGADFDLELWLVGRKHRLPLLFQAKKFVKPYDSYRAKLNYPAKTQQQLSTLISYAASAGRLPFYIFYSPVDPSGGKVDVMCKRQDADNAGMFIADAYSVRDFANGVHGNRISRAALLRRSNPFHCLFCCPLSRRGAHLRHYFRRLFSSDGVSEAADTPAYVEHLLSGEISGMSSQGLGSLIDSHGLRRFRAVAVYDLRDEDLEPNEALQPPR